MDKNEYIKICRHLTSTLLLSGQIRRLYSGPPGHCFMNALDFAMYNPGWLVAHGIGHDNEGEAYGHGWNEYQTKDGVWVVYCPSQSKKSPMHKLVVIRNEYYSSSSIKKFKRYTYAEANDLACKMGMCGPFEKRFKVNLKPD